MKQNRSKSLWILSRFILDASALTLSYELAYRVRFYSHHFLLRFPVTKGIPLFSIYKHALPVLLPVWLLMFYYAGFYKRNVLSAYDEFIQVLRGVILAALLTTTMSFAYGDAHYSRLVIGLWALFSLILIYTLHELDKFVYQRMLLWMSGPQRTLVIGKGRVVEAIREMAPRQTAVLSFMDSPSNEQILESHLIRHRISEVLLIQGSLSTAEILRASSTCEQLGIDCKIFPDLLEMRRGEIIVDGFHGLPTFQIRPLSLYGSNYALKRGFDLAVSSLALLVLAIPLALISLLIRLDSPGPILFVHERMGLRGQKFRFYKFRTMVANAHDMVDQLKHLNDRVGPAFKMKNDPRITRIGRWLRRYSLDELPQLINVVKGDMSLVGPRPQVLWEAAHYDDTAKKRLRVKPGITGLWQVSGRAELSYDQMINLDIFYLENWSLGLDLKIILRTLPAIFAKEGAY